MATAKSKRSTGGREPMSQEPVSGRNEALAVLASKGTYRDAAAAQEAVAGPVLPALTGRVYDLGGATEGVLLAPWFVAGERTVFRGDVVRAAASWFKDHPEFAVLAA